MEHADCGGERLEAEGEVAVARLAIDADDLAHAASHLADAMVADPQLPEVHEALAELCARAGGPVAALEYFPVDGEVYLGTVVCRSHVLAAAGEWDGAVDLLASAMQFEPVKPWAHTAWLARADLPGLVDPDGVARATARVTGGLPDPAPAELQDALRPFEAFVRAVMARHPEQVLLPAVASALVRRLGDTADAVRIVEEAHRRAPQHVTAVMLGNALRSDGRPDEALAVWTAEMRRTPDSHLAVDIAELLADTGRPAEGLPWLERALVGEPDHPKAAPARHALRHRIDGGTVHLLALADHARTHPEHDYAVELLARHCSAEPWLGGVTGTYEATVNMLHHVLETPGLTPEQVTSFKVSAPEPPSALLAARLAMPAVEVEFGPVSEPDPRGPADPGRGTVRIWEWEGTVPRAAVPAPAEAVAELVRATAEIRWPSLPAAYDHAVRLAGLPVADLLGVLAHPPAPREDALGLALLTHQPELWVRAVQAFACLGIAHHRTDQPWEDSERRRLLLDLLLGPEDWVAEAAGFALLTVAWVRPETRPDVGHHLLRRLRADASAYRQREVTVLPSVCGLVLACPWLAPGDLVLAREVAARHAADHAEPDPEPERPAGPARPEPPQAVRRPLLQRLFRRR